MFNSKLSPEVFVSVVEHISEGHSPTSITRTCHVHHDTVERIARVTAEHAQAIHDAHVQALRITGLQADERHGFAGTKNNPFWEATTLDPESKFVIGLQLGPRTEALIKTLLTDTMNRLLSPQNLVLFSDGLPSYSSLFPEVFGLAFRPSKSTNKGRRKSVQYKIPHSLAHVQVIKNREGHKLKTVEVRVAHGSQKRVNLELTRLGYSIANTSAIERQNGTARQSTMFMGRKGLSFAHLERSRVAAAEVARLSYNWVRAHSSLRVRLEEAVGRQKWVQRTPAMAVGISDRVWAWLDVLGSPVWALGMRNHST
jgi:IS1 family transposase